MKIKLEEELCVQSMQEKHYKLIINGKEVWISKWHKIDEFDTDGDTEIIKGEDKLTEEENDAVLDYIQERG